MKNHIIWLICIWLWVLASNDIFANEISDLFLYKDNIVKFGLRENTLNGKSFSGKILVGEDGKILHTILDDGDNYTLDGNRIDIGGGMNRVQYLENGGYIVTEFNPEKGKDNFITYNGKTLFRGNNDEYNIEISKYLINTRLIDTSKNMRVGFRQYFIYDNKFIPTLRGNKINVYFIDNINKDSIYDVTCKENILFFSYNGKELVNTNGIRKIYIPSKSSEDDFSIDTLLNINGVQYLSTYDEIGFDGCAIFIGANPTPISTEVKNGEIIKGVKELESNVETIEVIEGANILKVMDGLYFGWDRIYYGSSVYILKYPRKDSMKNIEDILNNSEELKKLIPQIRESGFSKPGKELDISLDEYKKLILGSKEIIIDVKNGSNELNTKQITQKNNTLQQNTTKKTSNISSDRSKYLKQKTTSSKNLRQTKMGNKKIIEIDSMVSKNTKERLKEMFDRIQKLKTKNDSIRYLEAKIFLKINNK